MLKWAALLGVLFLCLLVLGGCLAYAKRTAILNAVLADATAPYKMVAGSLDFDARGNLELFDVRLEEGGDTGVIIDIPHASAVVDFREALGGKIVSVKIDQPVIQVPLKTIMFSEAPTGLEAIEEEVSTIAPEFTSPRFALESLLISDAKVVIGGAISASFDYDADALTLFGDGSIETRRHQLSLRDVIFAAAEDTDAWLSIPRADVEFSINREGGEVQVHALEIPEGEIRWDAAMLRWLVDAGFGPLFVPDEDNASAAKNIVTAKDERSNNVPFSRLKVEQLRIGNMDVDIRGFAGLPNFAGTFSLDAAGISGPFASDSLSKELLIESSNLRIREIAVGLPGRPAIASLPEVEMSLSRGEDQIYKVDSLEADGGKFQIDPQLIAFFSGATAADPSSQREESSGQPDSRPTAEDESGAIVIEVVSASFRDSSLSVTGFDSLRDGRDFFVPDVSAVVDVQMRELLFSSDSALPLQSSARQEFSLTDIHASLAGAPDLATICGVQLALVPDDFLKNGKLLECLVDSPDIRLTEPFWVLFDEMQVTAPVVSGPASGTAVDATVEVAEAAPWQRVHAETFEVHNGFFEMVQTNSMIPNFSARVDAFTQATEGDGETRGQEYVIQSTDLEFFAPADPTEAFARAKSLQVIADSQSLWVEKRVTSATLSGAEMTAGKRFNTLLDDAEVIDDAGDASIRNGTGITAAEPGSDDDASVIISPRNDWHVGEFSVTDSVVIVEDIAALIPDISLPIKAVLADFPLTKQGFSTHEEPLKVEVAQLRIPSPYGQSRTPVAEFDSVFVHFTLGGLMRYELDKVELLNPTIYVGENLFWYVEFFRKADADEEAATVTVTSSAKVEPAAVQAAVKDDAWSIAQIDAFYGKLLIALNGSVNPDLPAFPFNCSTTLKAGTLTAQLDIPAGEYRPLEGVDLMVKVTVGRADFNLPLGQKSNNLVQVFKAEELRYKQFLTTDVHLSVTYDQYGIYAQFGGATYDGYTNGALNLYINDDFTWDAWVAGSKVNASEVTRVLTPEYYLMSGAADFKVIAQGDLGALYQANGNFSMDAPGIISIPALDELKDKFPTDWTVLESSLAQVGVAALRDLPYETCEADFSVFEREGTLNLKAAGPGGTRDFQVAVHDYRIPSPVKILELAYSSDDPQIEGSAQ
ncbi:MAG: hypothetical protein ACI9R3_000805 [Verrucomicrobiales bacterium]|jgi:hypothetical protein